MVLFSVIKFKHYVILDWGGSYFSLQNPPRYSSKCKEFRAYALGYSATLQVASFGVPVISSVAVFTRRS